MDILFRSFNNSVSVNNFQELSACIFNWLEEHCKPQVWYIFVNFDINIAKNFSVILEIFIL